MKTLILSLGLVAALAAPAAAGRLDDADPSVRQDYTASQTGIDYGATRAIQSTLAPSSQDGHFDKQRGDQGAYFGANGR